jgi:dienelactone hydrolase
VKILKALGVIVAVAILLLVGVGFLLPRNVEVERSAVIRADAATVFSYINNLEKLHSWSPWADLDPAMQVEFSGPESGVGASMSWSSAEPQVGNGAQKIIASESDKRVVTELEFEGKKGGESEFELVPQNSATEVIWRFRADFGVNPIARYFGLMVDQMLGEQYDVGLAKLRGLVEGLPSIVTEEVRYSVGDTRLNGYFAYPRNAQKVPAILVVHEWWGHNDYARKRAEMLAELGYVAFALDMYGDGKVTGHPKEANAFMMEVISNAEVAKARFEKGLELLKQHPSADPEKLAAVGYCFGGAVSISMARLGSDLDGVVSFHGALEGLAPVAEDGVNTRFLVLNGADDPFVTAEAKATFKSEMDAAQLQYEFVDYPGAVHAFTNPDADEKGEAYGLPLKYNAEADQDSWQRMQAFFKEIF